jgi:histidinol-phosphatase
MLEHGEIERAMHVARRAAEAAGEAALAARASGLDVRRKPDRSLVTRADFAAERAILDVIRDVFPDDALLAEESGHIAGRASDRRWIVDPLDGTRGFSRGGLFWGPLVALEAAGTVVAGAMALPALGRTYWAGRGLGAWRENGTRLRVSPIEDWSEATLAAGELQNLLRPATAAGIEMLVRSAAQTRCPGDLAGAALVLDGLAEAWLEAGVKPWDVAAVHVLVEEAGGRFSDFVGRVSIDGGQALASNGLVHQRVLAALSGRHV